MEPLSGYVMLKKRPAAERKSGLVLPDGQEEEVEATGFDVIKVASDVDNIKAGDVVFPGYAEEARKINKFIFCKANHIIAKD